MRRTGTIGLNYFKANGPKDVVEFRKLDYHLLLYLFFKNQKVIDALFDGLKLGVIKAACWNASNAR